MIVTDSSPQTLFKSTGKLTVLSCLLISFPKRSPFMPKAYYLSVMFQDYIFRKYRKTKKTHFL